MIGETSVRRRRTRIVKSALLAGLGLAAVMVPAVTREVQAQETGKWYVLKIAYKVGARTLDDVLHVQFTAQTIQFGCDQMDRTKGPVVPRAGGSNAYADGEDSQGWKRACRVTVRQNADRSLFFTTVKTMTTAKEANKDTISFQLSFAGAACRIQSIRYVFNDNADPYTIPSASCQ